MTFAAFDKVGDRLRMRARGAWIAANAEAIDEALADLPRGGREEIEFDLSALERLDTSGAWILLRTGKVLEAAGATVRLAGVTQAHAELLKTIAERTPRSAPKARRPSSLVRFFAETGETVAGAGRDLLELTSFFGAVAAGLMRVVIMPWRFRMTSVAHHLEHAGMRAVPIVALMSFLVGGIVAQQGAFQLRAYGAELMTVNLVAVLTLREVGALLTAIMIAGRSGSAFTAELGSMKMREEIDALTVFGLNVVDVLVLPRLIALIVAMPLLVFLADISALAGAGLVSWIYIGITPETFIAQLRGAVNVTQLSIGLIKAPFMALVVGLVACVEGLRVEGSAESLGRHTTASVVKAIFMVIVMDGLFAMFFGIINI